VCLLGLRPRSARGGGGGGEGGGGEGPHTQQKRRRASWLLFLTLFCIFFTFIKDLFPFSFKSDY
jgi:hypothetical protein